jgi:hypothetical protein
VDTAGLFKPCKSLQKEAMNVKLGWCPVIAFVHVALRSLDPLIGSRQTNRTGTLLHTIQTSKQRFISIVGYNKSDHTPAQMEMQIVGI